MTSPSSVTPTRWKWAREHKRLVFLLVLIAGFFPIIAGFVAVSIAEHRSVVILAALVGAWPDLNPTVVDKLGPWIGVGVGFSAFAVFGIPTILGLLVAYYTEKIERRVAMSLGEYLTDRDRFIEGYIYREFKDKVKTNISNKECLNFARAAVRQAAEEWKNASDEAIRRAIDEIDVPEPDR